MSTRDHPDWWRPIGGQNSQDSTLERRSLVWNDSGIVDGVVPPGFYTVSSTPSKFFTRGCRGKIERIEAYCAGAWANGLIIRYSPHPCIGPYNQVNITPLAGWSWQGVNVREMWNYDSLFIWIYAFQPGVMCAYDELPPYDCHQGIGGGAQWNDVDRRLFIRVIYTGETPGDVPVSGIINNIEIPNVGAYYTANAIVVQNNLDRLLLVAEGAGELLEARLVFGTSVVPAAGVRYSMRFFMDQSAAYIYEIDNRLITQSVVATFGRCAIGEFYQDGDLDITVMTCRLPLEFRRNFQLHALQTTGALVNTDGYATLSIKV